MTRILLLDAAALIEMEEIEKKVADITIQREKSHQGKGKKTEGKKKTAAQRPQEGRIRAKKQRIQFHRGAVRF
jgi:hypothetical protein